MEDGSTPQPAADTKKLTELALLYQFSNTLLSTIRLNKLTHLILTALTSGTTPLFERAMLFLHNEKTGTLQGMLGVIREMPGDLEVVGGDDDPLSSRWDISDDVIARQKATGFCCQVRSTRIDIDDSCNFISQVILKNQLYQTERPEHDGCPACSTISKLGMNVFAAVPLLSRDKNLGMIVVDNPLSGAEITRDRLHFLQLIATRAGMAIENSMLYNRLESAHSSLREARERLVHGERLAAIGEMAASLAHELKNPLITIGGFAGRLVKTLPHGSREMRYADTIVKEASRLEKMLAEILTFSSKPTICYHDCDMEVIVKECLENCSTTLEDSNIILHYSSSNGPWPVLCDDFQLKQVFLNLILNACEAMPNGGVLTVNVHSVTLDKPSVQVTISDTGGGISPDMLPRIFIPFFTTKRHGTGLGLAIVNRILTNHSGSIEAANTDKGAVFKVTLPLAAHIMQFSGM